MICVLNDKGYCFRHDRVHYGHTRTIALDPSEHAEKIRALWSTKQPASQAQGPRLLRSLPMARQCIHLGERLTLDEVKEKQLVGCRTCNNKVPAFHCKLPGAKKFNDGPYTRETDCMNCGDWQKQNTTDTSWLPVNGDWVKDPNVWPMFREMIQQEIASYRE